MTDTPIELLRAFLADENDAFPERRQGKFWPRNHHRLSPLVAKVEDLLDQSEREDFYFHLMRVTGGVPQVSEKEMPLLINAYRRLLPFLDDGGIIQMGRRHEMLYTFGFDETGVLDSGETNSAKALKTRRKLISQVGSYTSQPAQRDKKSKFASFADDAVRIQETFRHLGYRHDRRYGEDMYDVTNLSFWGMAFICLLNTSTRTVFLADMMEGTYDLPRRDEQFAMLHRYVEAVIPDVHPDETHFQSLALQLKKKELARCNSTEAADLARKLGLPFDESEHWEIYISIGLRGSDESPLIAGNVVRLRMSPDPDRQWNLTVRLNERGELSESEEKCYRNDLGLPALGPGNLDRFPIWLKRVREDYGLDFDAETADIRVGRKRAAAKLILKWIAT
ncbi:hypothetical protein A6R70_24585 [Agrobacterium rubi]|uniref:hypothetical protein n=1 Tax=Agrobacterium rubi TaxID=28099 RepID=UPI0005EB6FBC|nr:hypothetical protein [Agrobacterium rubi]MBP1881705.1 hypothetical protein [Agrobacterium rubi]MCL6655448.1 hypothetical protein [Agrobacterium rubi]